MNELVSTAGKWVVLNKTDEAVGEFVTRVLKLTDIPRVVTDRRHDKRTAYPHLLTLTPLDDDVLQVVGEPVTVVGKHIAQRGLDFFHVVPLSFKRAIVSFEESLHLDNHFVLKIGWCRFLRPGWYDSGGRFTHIITPKSGGDVPRHLP